MQEEAFFFFSVDEKVMLKILLFISLAIRVSSDGLVSLASLSCQAALAAAEAAARVGAEAAVAEADKAALKAAVAEASAADAFEAAGRAAG